MTMTNGEYLCSMGTRGLSWIVQHAKEIKEDHRKEAIEIYGSWALENQWATPEQATYYNKWFDAEYDGSWKVK